MRLPRLALAVLPLLATACGGASSDGGEAHSCTLTYAGGVTESVWCDAPVLRSNGSGGYVLWVMAFRGSAAAMDQAGQVTVTIDPRPVINTDYGWTGATVDPEIASGFETRTASGGTDTHEAIAGTSGAFNVRFSAIPATDGADPTGFDGIGTIHGTWTATLEPISSGSNVTVSGSF